MFCSTEHNTSPSHHPPIAGAVPSHAIITLFRLLLLIPCCVLNLILARDQFPVNCLRSGISPISPGHRLVFSMFPVVSCNGAEVCFCKHLHFFKTPATSSNTYTFPATTGVGCIDQSQLSLQYNPCSFMPTLSGV